MDHKDVHQIQYTVKHVVTLFIKLEFQQNQPDPLTGSFPLPLPPPECQTSHAHNTFLSQWQHNHLHVVTADHILVNIAVFYLPSS